MKRLWAALAFAALAFLCAVPASAQNAPSLPVLATCGTASYIATNLGYQTILPGGETCIHLTGTVTVTGASSNASSGVATSSTNLPTIAYNYAFNGTTWDQVQDDSAKNLKTVQMPSADSATGIAPGVAGSAVSSLVIKNAAGNLYGVYVTPTASGYVMIFNSTTAPSNGSTTAGVASGNMQDCFFAAANQTTSLTRVVPEVFSVGITATFSSTACTTLTLSATAFIQGSAK